MELMRTQEILARLYTEASLRERFFADPRSVANELDMNEPAVELLARLSAAQVDQFASSLVRKRAREVSKLLPLTARVLRGGFEGRFWQFAESYQPKGIRKHFDDALAFAGFLRQRVRERAWTPAWIGDLASYEAAILEATHSTRWFVWRYFRYPVTQLGVLAIQRDHVPSVDRQPSIAIWLRTGRRGRLWHMTLPLPVLSYGLATLRLNDRGISEDHENLSKVDASSGGG